MTSPSSPLRTRLKKRARSVAVLAATVTSAIALAGCSLSPSSGSSASGDQTLTVGIWKGYGADLPFVAKQFKAETGASLKFVYIDSEQNLLDLMGKADGGIDVGLPNMQYIGPGIDSGLFAPLDTEKLTNYDDIYSTFSDVSVLHKNGKVYGIPWTYGSTGLFYNTTVFPTAPTSLSVLFDKKYAGKIALTDDATVEVPTAALYAGEDPQKPDMATLEPTLQAMKDNAKVLYSSTDDLAKAIASGTVDVGIANSDGIGGMIGAGQADLAYTIPKEGAVGWIDNWAISAKTKKTDLAYKWLNYMTGSKFLTTWTATPSYAAPAPANEKVAESLDASVQTRLQADPDKISSLALQLPQTTDTLQSWQDTWLKVKAG